MASVKLLDCTLRDGGYYTNWDFDTKMVRDLIWGLDQAGVDIIELGYKSPVKGGKYRKCNDKFIWEVLDNTVPSHAELAFMIDAKDFIKEGKVNYLLVDDVIFDRSNSPFRYCRVAIKHDEIDHAYELVPYIQAKGYEVVVNLMGISNLTVDQIKDLDKLNTLTLKALYFADSYGNLEPSKVEELVELFKSFYFPVGVHTHDNLGLAFANCIAAMNAGATWIDGTMLGMGRGVGNVKTEQLVTYLENKHEIYSSRPLLNLVADYMEPLRAKHQWGFTHNYMVSGLRHIHPLYTQTLQSTYLTPERIEEIILSIDTPGVYDYEKIREHLEPKVAVVIPARFKSSRFPGKPLAKIKGKEMIIWVAEIAEKAVGKSNVYIATENEEIVDTVKGYGYKVVLTSDKCLTGTDRVAEAALEIDADVIVNIQGDEPMLNPNDIKKVIEHKLAHPDHIINCMAYLNKYEGVEDKKIPKVVTTLDNELLYMSRNAIPGTKTGNGNTPKKQVCIYAFTKQELKQFTSNTKKTPLEFEEDIEIVRFLELGTKVKMVLVDSNSHAVDYPEDIKIVEKLL